MAWAAVLASGAAGGGSSVGAAEDEVWRKDIPRAVEALKGYQRDWPRLNEYGKATAGANLIREGMVIRYTDSVTVTVPPGQKLGVNVYNCKVTAVARPELGWMEGDRISNINGVDPDMKDNILQDTIAAASDAGKPLTVTVLREGPPLLDNFESKVQQAYMALGEEGLGDLEELQILIGNVKLQAASAASATNASPETMTRLRTEIDNLVKDLTPFVKVISK